MFFGRYDCVLDAKGRLNFPARFREEMGESFVVMEWIGRCLFALPMAEVERLSEKLGADELMDSWEICSAPPARSCRTSRGASCCLPHCGSMRGWKKRSL